MSVRKPLPCGHIGECVIGTFYRCLTKGCDGLVRPPASWSHADPGDENEDTDPGQTLSAFLDCPKCKSSSTEPFSTQVPGSWHCNDCGTLFHP